MGLTGLRGTVFGALAALEDLDLKNNRLTTLPASVFAGRGALVILDLEGNDLANLNPAGLFEGLDALEDLDLRDNELATFVRGDLLRRRGARDALAPEQPDRGAAGPHLRADDGAGRSRFLGQSGRGGFPAGVRGLRSGAGERAAEGRAHGDARGEPLGGEPALGVGAHRRRCGFADARRDADGGALVRGAEPGGGRGGRVHGDGGPGAGTAASRSRDAQITIDATASATGVMRSPRCRSRATPTAGTRPSI